jgi:hypothetical protein
VTTRDKNRRTLFRGDGAGWKNVNARLRDNPLPDIHLANYSAEADSGERVGAEGFEPPPWCLAYLIGVMVFMWPPERPT